ncbi:hypothetical protein BLNAU_10262 [Blattamonas nauphoetae]|uniref:Uncharacterized protein n=1 Tax=Blattamonas nauphoetae TaxID=2049346 RepID=A0ABQ9XTH9_9EUKA|nr:hypothetical protein BLNAU_10262 [Blattamonas nauphoetae]
MLNDSDSPPTNVSIHHPITLDDLDSRIEAVLTSLMENSQVATSNSHWPTKRSKVSKRRNQVASRRARTTRSPSSSSHSESPIRKQKRIKSHNSKSKDRKKDKKRLSRKQKHKSSHKHHSSKTRSLDRHTSQSSLHRSNHRDERKTLQPDSSDGDDSSSPDKISALFKRIKTKVPTFSDTWLDSVLSPRRKDRLISKSVSTQLHIGIPTDIASGLNDGTDTDNLRNKALVGAVQSSHAAIAQLVQLYFAIENSDSSSPFLETIVDSIVLCLDAATRANHSRYFVDEAAAIALAGELNIKLPFVPKPATAPHSFSQTQTSHTPTHPLNNTSIRQPPLLTHPAPQPGVFQSGGIGAPPAQTQAPKQYRNQRGRPYRRP